MTLPRIMVAPNGARLTKADHPAIPLTLDEIVETAIACQAKGAGALHLHLRDGDGRHLLDAGAYAEALAELSRRVPGMAVQITTEAAGIYEPDHQRRVALDSGASMASISLREMLRAPGAVAFYRACAEAGIAVQHILYDLVDAQALATTLPRDMLRDPSLQLIYVLGRYSAGQVSSPRDLDPFLDWLARTGLRPDWAVCAFGPAETDCLLHAARNGGKCRIGFENSRHNRDGSLAASNAERVHELATLCAPVMMAC